MRIFHHPLLLASVLLLTATAPVVAQSKPSEMAQAIAAQRKLAEASPNDASLWNDLGNLLWTNHQEKEAAVAYKRASSADPASAAPHYNLGLLLAEQGKLKEALEQFHSVLQTEPKSAWAHYQIGSVYQRQGLRDKAVEEYASAFRIDPNLSFADINPQVVANPLITEALMRAFENAPAATLAPRSYSNPGHIAGLFLPPTPSTPPETKSTSSPRSGTAQVITRVSPAEKPSPEQTPTSVGTRMRERRPEISNSGAQVRVRKAPAIKERGAVRRRILVPQMVIPGAPGVLKANGKTGAPSRPQVPAQGAAGQSQPQAPRRSVPANPSTGRLDLHLVDDPAPAG